MTIDSLKRLASFILLWLAQGLVFNRIQLFGCAMPLLYVYFVMKFPASFPRWASLLWSFAMGACVDMFANTPGVAMAGTTLLAFIQPSMLNLFLPHDAEENAHAAVSIIGWGKFVTYTLIMVLIYSLVFFSLEAFSFFNWFYWLQCVGGSWVLTTLLILALESVKG